MARMNNVILFTALLGLCHNALATIKFTMLYPNNPVIYTEKPFQIVWTGAEALANITFTDSNGTISLIDSYNPQTTFDWIPNVELAGHRGNLGITDGASTQYTAQFSFVDGSERAQTSPSFTQTTTPTATITQVPQNSNTVGATSTSSPGAVISTTPMPTPTESGDSKGLSLGARAGIVVGVLVAIGALMSIGYYLIFFRRRRGPLDTEKPKRTGRYDNRPYRLAQNKLRPSLDSISPSSPTSELAGKDVTVITSVNEVPVELPCEQVRGTSEKFLASQKIGISNFEIEAADNPNSADEVHRVEDKCLRRDM